ncbi:MAG: drug/metabolite transporter (DMT)-like permease [Paracoccaceae bacterium]|jgi:drug/metabolite transporter (DMT)-like permease
MKNPFANLPPVIAGPAWMILAGLGYTLASVCTRELSSDYSTAQLAFMRGGIALGFVAPLILRNGVSVMHTKVFPLHLLRSFFTYGGMMCWFYAVSVIPISDYTALLYFQPIFTILFAILILREVAGPRTWGAVAVAFVGALIILRPGFQDISLGMIAALATAVLFAGVNTCMKFLSRTESAAVMVAYVSILMLVLSAVPAWLYWTDPVLADAPMILGVGIFALLGQYAITRAIAVADARVIQPFDFSRLITAALLGWLVFGETSDAYTWAGALVIFCASYYVIVFERKGGH